MRSYLDYLVETDNVKRAAFAMAEFRRRYTNAPGRDILIIQGLAGLGKTSFGEVIAVRTPGVEYLEADENWTPSWMLRDVAGVLGLKRAHSAEENKRAIVALQQSQPRILIIDEADRLLWTKRVFETARGLHDAGIPLVLLGEESLYGDITRKSTRFADRVSHVEIFRPITAADIADAALHLADLKLNNQAEYIHRQAGGNFRRAANIVGELEMICKTNPGELNRARIDLAVKNLELAESRDKRRAARGRR
jgi:DNA transposition AAA+ family ATPase